MARGKKGDVWPPPKPMTLVRVTAQKCNACDKMIELGEEILAHTTHPVIYHKGCGNEASAFLAKGVVVE